ncbi:Z1 domain-containing protein [soil metagenome]
MKLGRRMDDAPALSSEEIRDVVRETIGFYGTPHVDVESIVRDLEASFQTRIGVSRILSGQDTNWEPWLTSRKADIDWRFWNRYEQYLLEYQGWAAPTLRRLDETTDRVLGLLTDPKRVGAWDRRGMVVGDVQSGKTSNYIGLICKAADAGYQLIVVLTGFHNSLRSQTQIRMENGFLGYDRAASAGSSGGQHAVGVGLIDGRPKANSITTRANNGDFQRKVADQFGIQPGGQPLLFVIKKNQSVLRNLLNWVEWVAGADSRDEQGHAFIRGVPLLVIDDEADQGSVDTKDQEFDEFGTPDMDHNPTAINRSIRRLLHLFDQSAYVGYTATPFANIFIHEKARTAEGGEDLFPRSFIVSLPTPSNHVGPSRIFAYETENGQTRPGLPVMRIVDDHAESQGILETRGWVPPRHRKDHLPRYQSQDRPPPSLREAIHAFVLVIAARLARRRHGEHNSMLIHVTRFTFVQGHVHDQVSQELIEIQRRLRIGDGYADMGIRDELRGLWNRDFLPTSVEVQREESGSHVQAWDEIEPFVPQAALSIKVRLINGYAGEVLDYVSHEAQGLNVIAIGGDKLSRGLTLEGLSISYFLRASRMYDTLMQMGRWFGYRPGYLDLCRLYTTPEMADWFSHIAQASDELRADFDRMAASGGTPRDFGHRVRSHPIMLVTSQVKMRNGQRIEISYQGDISETIDYSRRKEDLAANWNAGLRLVEAGERLGSPLEGSGGGAWVRSGLPASLVLDFLAAYKAHQASKRVIPKLLADYIRAEHEHGRLASWTLLVAAGNSPHSVQIGSEELRLVERSWYLSESNDEGKETQKKSLQQENHFRIRRLVSPVDEMADLTIPERRRAMDLTEQDWKDNPESTKSPPTRPSGPRVREVRDPGQGLIMLYPIDGRDAGLGITQTGKVEPDAAEIPVIGFAISFPKVDPGVASKVQYIVNNLYYRQEVFDASATSPEDDLG